jgi:hypothetical protein
MQALQINPENVIELVRGKVAAKHAKVTLEFTKKERLLADELFEMLEQLCNAPTYEIETETDLVREDANEVDDRSAEPEMLDENEELNVTVSTDCATSDDYKPSPVAVKRANTLEERFTLEEMRAIVDKKDKHGWALSTIMHHHRKVKSHKDITVMRKILAGQPRKHDAYRQIRAHVFTKFKEFESAHLPIHDSDLQSWAHAKATELGCDSFCASDSWVYSFKKKYGIRSRKTTKFVTTAELAKEGELAIAADDFRAEFQRKVSTGKYKKIFNADQVGVNLEFVSNRTLRVAGSKDVFLCIKSKNNITHSLTIMPTIDTEGNLLSPLFVCLMEPSGSFGVNVQQNLYKSDNLFVTCSTSGKMNNALFKEYLTHVVMPNTVAKEKFLIVLDSWAPHKNEQLIAECLLNRKYDVMIVPPGTTAHCQPLDTTFNRQVKAFLKRTTEKTRHLDRMNEITGRNNFLRLLSLMHSELSSAAFRDLIRYAWFSAGLCVNKPTFSNVKQVCFRPAAGPCEVCKDANFIVCANDGRSYCFNCFFNGDHTH